MVGKAVRMTRRGTLLLAGALLATACSGTTTQTTTSVAPPSTTPAPATTAAPPTTPATTTTAPPVTTTRVDPLARPDKLVSNVNRGSIDDFDTTGDDLYRVMLETQDLFNFLEGNPTDSAEEMVSLLFEPAYPFWGPILGDFELLAGHPGWHYVDPGMRTIAIEVLDVEENVALIRLVDERGDQQIADENGDLVVEFAGWERSVSTITLRRGDDGRWKFFDLTPSEPISDQDVARMVPVEWTGRA